MTTEQCVFEYDPPPVSRPTTRESTTAQVFETKGPLSPGVTSSKTFESEEEQKQQQYPWEEEASQEHLALRQSRYTKPTPRWERIQELQTKLKSIAQQFGNMKGAEGKGSSKAPCVPMMELSEETKAVVLLEPKIAALERVMGLDTNTTVQLCPIPQFLAQHESTATSLRTELKSEKVTREMERSVTSITNATVKYGEKMNSCGIVLKDHDVHPVLPTEDSLNVLHMTTTLAPHVETLLQQLEHVSQIKNDLGQLALTCSQGQEEISDKDVEDVRVCVSKMEETVRASIGAMTDALATVHEEVKKRRAK